MTIIAAFDDKNKYWIASDSIGSAGQIKYEIGTKLIKKGNYIIGFSWSYRIADMIRECQDLPEKLNGLKDLRILRDIIKAIVSRDDLIDSDQELRSGSHPLDIIIISPTGIYTLENDYQIHRVSNRYAANGSGAEIAMGVLYSCKELDVHGGDAVKLAVKAAVKHITTCGGRCYVKSIKKK